VILIGDFYPVVKLVTDSMGMMTQCLKWKNIIKPPRGFHMNVMLKINTKLGGTNHTLASRLSPEESRSAPATYQDPPASLCWVFDKPCMLVGIDTSHPEPNFDKKTVAAVVGSLNGQASQYAAHISAQDPRAEMVSALSDAMFALLTTFKNKNMGRLPEHMIVYRDGVSEGQFEQALAIELPAIRDALELHGSLDCKIVFVVCHKRHHTRLVFEDAPNNFVNCCPGLCVDGSGKEKSIVSAVYNEFFLNSHTAIQGTAKACRYTLLHDEIGMKMSELELLTYWSCYLYTRCNRSVSLATPCYYAHWASRRAKHLVTAGASDSDLEAISKTWNAEGCLSTMFFV
jgi:eukaryotic translation initiation factor 2C